MVKRQRNHNYTSKGSPAVPDLLSHVSLLFLFWHVRYSRMSLSPEHTGPGVCTENLKKERTILSLELSKRKTDHCVEI